MTTSVSISLALSMAGPAKTSSQEHSPRATSRGIRKRYSTEFSIYKGISNRPLGWKPRRTSRTTATNPMARDVMRKWDGGARTSSSWDGLRRDPELWFADGDCFVHLYELGQSRRGPAFRVPLHALRAAGCKPLLDRFLVEVEPSSPLSSSSSSSCRSYFDHPKRQYELYIPPPKDVARGEAFLYHTATRNFFAWLFGESLVGTHLGGALVGLLNSMNEFRREGEDNIRAIMDFMDEEGYGDMRNQPDHALAILFFAEHFQFRDLWIDAFAHCCGMHEKLTLSPGFEFISRSSRALITRSRLEMDMRLDNCGRRLGSFLSDDLSEAHLGLSAGARAHLDDFRSFLQGYFVAKLGYYPPTSSSAQNAAFPKHIFGQMCTEFQSLYDFLVDDSSTTSSPIPPAHSGGICVQQTVEMFDKRHKYTGLLYPLPRLPEAETSPRPPPALRRRFSFLPKHDKLLPDPRLVTYASLSKATNSRRRDLLECSLVRAYRGFEKECVFTPSKVEKNEKLSQTEARKVRWIFIYAILQTLISATQAPEQVSNTHNVPYNLCVVTGGCPPWSEELPYTTLLRTQTDQAAIDSETLSHRFENEKPIPPISIEPDVDHYALLHPSTASTSREIHSRDTSSSASASHSSPRKGSIKSALNTLGNMPPLVHPTPHRSSYHEILVHGYGNGTNTVTLTGGSPPSSSHQNEPSSDSEATSPKKSVGSRRSTASEADSFRWSSSSIEDQNSHTDSPSTSVASNSRRGSECTAASHSRRSSIATVKDDFDLMAEEEERDMAELDLERVPSSIWGDAVDESTCWVDEEEDAPTPVPREVARKQSYVEIPRRSSKRDLRNIDTDGFVPPATGVSTQSERGNGFEKPQGEGKGNREEI